MLSNNKFCCCLNCHLLVFVFKFNPAEVHLMSTLKNKYKNISVLEG